MVIPSPRRLAALAVALALATGCDSKGTGLGSPGATGSRPASDIKPATPAKAATATGTAAKIEGDRMADLAPVVASPAVPQEPSPFRFAEIAKEAGIDFVELSGMETATKHFPTANGSGVALFDYDGDGKLDIYFATGTYLPVGSRPTGTNRLYKNLGGGKFKDVTESSGLGFRGYCHGIIAGDIDNDGDQDVFLCNCGPNALYLNNGDGTFTDISKKAGIDRDAWSSSGAMLDYDDDGDLDIYVSNYGKWKLPEDDVFCGDKAKGVRLYCSPRTIKTVKHFFYRNNGDRTFTDVYDQVIIDPATKKPRGRDDGHGFGVVAADLDLDGKVDLWVANDMNPNFTFRNLGKGTFEDITETAGAAFNPNGQPQSGMGVDCEDVNADGLPDLFVTNFANEPDSLFQNLGKASFLDTTTFFGLAADSMPYVKWGVGLCDFDGDGWPDCFVTNGHVDDNRRQLGQPIDYEEPPMLHRNVDGRRFKLSTRGVGPYFDSKHVGRGAAFGDLDDDGDIDIVVNHKDAPPAVLRNDTPMGGNAWIRLQLVGTKSNRDAIGARVKVQVGPRTIWRQRKGGCSMLSTNDARLTIGLGRASTIDAITINWPSGAEQVLKDVKPNQALKVVEPKESAAAGGAK